MIQRLERVPLWQLLIASLFIYWIYPFWFPILNSYDSVPVLDIRAFAPSLAAGLVYGFLFCALCGLFYASYRQIKAAENPPSLKKILSISFLFGLPLVFSYPINANDIFRYFIRGRIFSFYGSNPFATPPSFFTGDPFLPLAGEWVGETSPYGPVWELLAAIVTGVVGENLLAGLLLFKLLNLLILIAAAGILWWLFIISPDHKKGDCSAPPAAYTMLWAWNPALMFIFILNGHNDALMIFWFLLGALIVRLQYPTIGLLTMMVASLTKPIGFLPLPLFFVRIFREKETIKERVLFVVLSFVGGLTLLVITFWQFGSPWELLQRLMREAGEGGGFSPGVLLILAGQKAGIEIPVETVAQIGSVLLVLLFLTLIFLSWKGRSAYRSTAELFWGYSLQALNFRIWYAAWPFPWLLIDAWENQGSLPVKFRLRVGFWFLFFAQLSVLVYGHFRIYLFGGEHFWAHLFGVPLVFGGSLLMAFLGQRVAK